METQHTHSPKKNITSAPQGAQQPAPEIADTSPLHLQRAMQHANPNTLKPAVVTALQRSYGNRFVNNLLQRMSRMSTPAIQRAGFDIPEDTYTAYLKTSFLARVNLLPKKATEGGKYAPDEIWVDAVKLSDDRPPTQYGTEGQRSHTVAWTLTRAALEAMKGQSLGGFISILDDMLKHLKTPDKSLGDAPKAHTALKNIIAEGRKAESEAKSIAEWEQYATALLTRYVHLYQISADTTRRDGLAVGHNEAGHMATLRSIETKGGDTEDEKGLIKAALTLVDLSTTEDNKATLNHWLNNLYLAFPQVMEAHGDDIKSAAEKKYSVKLSDPLTAITDKNASVEEGPDVTAAAKPLPEDIQSTFTAFISLKPQMDSQEDDEMEPTYAHKSITISGVNVSDDRPNTRYGYLQKSHTVAWTFIRRHLMSFKGKPLDTLHTFLMGEMNDLEPHLHDEDAKKGLADQKSSLTEINSQSLPVYEWQRIFSELIENYITLYQLSHASTYAKEERPAGHGEANAMKYLTDYEASVNPLKAGEAQTQALKLLDAIIGQASLSPQAWKRAIEHWLKLLNDMFPKMMAQKDFQKDMLAKLTTSEVREELIKAQSGYDKDATAKEKLQLEIKALSSGDTFTQGKKFNSILANAASEYIELLLKDLKNDDLEDFVDIGSSAQFNSIFGLVSPKVSNRRERTVSPTSKKRKDRDFTDDDEQPAKKQKGTEEDKGERDYAINIVTRATENKKEIAKYLFKSFIGKSRDKRYSGFIDAITTRRSEILAEFETLIVKAATEVNDAQSMKEWLPIIEKSDDDLSYESIIKAIDGK